MYSVQIKHRGEPCQEEDIFIWTHFMQCSSVNSVPNRIVYTVSPAVFKACMKTFSNQNLVLIGRAWTVHV